LLGPPATVVLTLAVAAAAYWLATAVPVVTGDALLAEPQRMAELGGWAGVARRLAGLAALGLAATLVVMPLCAPHRWPTVPTRAARWWSPCSPAARGGTCC